MSKFEDLGDEYNVDANVVYFSSAGQSVLPKSVEAIGITSLQRKLKPWLGVGSDDDVQEIRRLYGSLINASPDCIAVCPSTAFAMSLAAKNIVQMGVLHPTSCCVLLEKEFPSSVYPWQEACNATGAAFRVVESSNDPNFDWADQIIDLLDEDVAVLVLPIVHWCDGARINIEKIAAFLEQISIEIRPFLIIDATQSIGAMPFDVKAIKPSFVACTVHKWLNGPMGMSIMYLDESLHELWEPLDHHERAREGSNLPDWEEEIHMDNLTGYPTAFFPGARRLDAAGRYFNPIVAPMVLRGLQLTLKWSPAAVQEHLTSLTDLMVDKLTTALGSSIINIRTRSQRCGHILGIRLHRELSGGVVDPVSGELYTLSSLGAELKRNDIHVSIRGGCVRVAPYLFNTVCDVNRFVTSFVQLIVYRFLRHHPIPMAVDVPPPPVSLRELTEGGTPARRGSNTINMGLRTPSNDSYDEGNSGSNSGKPPTAPSSSVGTSAGSMFPMPAKKITILITGTAGWLGQIVSEAIVSKALGENFELFAGYDKTVPKWIIAEQRVHLCLTDRQSISEAVSRVQPNVLIHLAAVSSPVACDKDPAMAMSVNCPEHLIESVKQIVPDCLFLFASTDMVYDGEAAPYNVISATKPVNVYGKTKLAFESLVTTLRHGIVLRLSNMIGRPYVFQPAGCKFGQFLSDSCRERKFVSIRTDEVRSFVYVMDVLTVILRAIKMHFPNFKGESSSAAAAASLAALSLSGSSGTASPSTPNSVSSSGSAGSSASAPKTLRKVGSFTTGSASANANNANSCTNSCVRKVLNVGGPCGLSRMQLAGIVAKAMGCRLKVSPTASEAAALPGDTWEVSASSSAPAGSVTSPRDISMNSVMTENHFQFKFCDLETVMKLCI